MGNHIHLLMTPASKASLPKTMQGANVRYVWHFNRRHKRTGPLFESRYKPSVVDTDAYLKVCYQYIELNPVRANFCKRPDDYRWSSHRHHAYGEPDRVVSLHHGYRALGRTDEDRQKRYQGWFEGRPSEADLAGIRAST
jgi:putative transposase